MILPVPLGFQWDKGNINKNLVKHGVSNQEIEEVFQDRGKLIFTDVLHSGDEKRFRLIGRTKDGKLLFIVFTVRGEMVRVISARNINKGETSLYEKRT